MAVTDQQLSDESNTDNMPSKIRLDSYVVINTDGSLLHGERIGDIQVPTAGKVIDGKVIEKRIQKTAIRMQSARLPVGLKAPDNCLIMLYGLDSPREIVRQRELLTRNDPKVGFHVFSIDFEVGKIATQVVAWEKPKEPSQDNRKKNMAPPLVQNQRFLNIARIHATVQRKIFEKFQEYIESDGGEPLFDPGEKRMREALAARPDLWSRLVQEPPFDEVEILVFPVNILHGLKDGKSDYRQFALVTPRAQMVAVIQNEASATLAVPPDWLHKNWMADYLRWAEWDLRTAQKLAEEAARI